MIVVLACGVVAQGVCTGAASAEPFGLPTYVPPLPRDDRADLADLAPPSARSTAVASYGDAIFARRPRVSAFGAHASNRTRVTRQRGCQGPTSDTNFKGCPGPASAFFQRNVVFTPSYVSAPQVVEQEQGSPTPLLGPVAGFFLDPVP